MYFTQRQHNQENSSKFMFVFVDITKSDDLKNHLMEGVDYELLPVEAWESLLNWYGMVDGSVPVPRIVQEHGQYVKSLKVEVYLTKLKLCRNSDMKECVVKKFSKNATLGKYPCVCSTALIFTTWWILIYGL